MLQKCLHIFSPAALLLILNFTASAQVDTENPADTVVLIENTDKPLITADDADSITINENAPSPRKASLFSAALPGLGQAYNKKYWKIPIIYAGASIFVYYVNTYNDNYTFFLKNLKAESDTDPETINTTDFNQRNLERRTDFYRRNRDFMIILTGFWYMLNIVDAHVDAHLQGFDISKDIALKINPSVERTAFNTNITGLSLSFTLKK